MPVVGAGVGAGPSERAVPAGRREWAPERGVRQNGAGGAQGAPGVGAERGVRQNGAGGARGAPPAISYLLNNDRYGTVVPETTSLASELPPG